MRHQAIYNTHPEAKSIHDDGGAFDIDGNAVEIDEALVSQEIVKLQAEYKAKEYQRTRAQAYPPIADQLDSIFHVGIDGWKATIQAVKDKFPKEVV
jgi:hypothetical protein